MDGFDSYFRTLRVFLPRGQRDDIIRELSEELRSQASEKEAKLGRPLSADEQAVIIGQYGHPLLTAARYWPQRHLIGPVVFPYYWTLLKVVLVIVGIAHLAGAIVMVANGGTLGDMGGVIEDAFATGLKAIGWITVVAAACDFWLSRSRVLENWRPQVEPPRALAKASLATASIPGSKRAADPTVLGFVVSAVVGVWWLVGLKVPSFFFGPGAVSLDWGPAMDRLYPVLVVAQLTMLGEQFLRLTRTDDIGVFRVTSLVWLVTGWALIGLVATSDHQWMLWQGEAAARGNRVILQLAGREISLAQFVNYVWSAIFIGAAVASAWGSLKRLRRRLKPSPSIAGASPRTS
jgi:hypothetical protein